MKKKVFKYIKFIISSVLILGLIAPSYASLSASDGSAFVTKAEFDSALADFNSRLTTFEAGINSKIDSQVTSYLDRNGIWNGHLQEILNDCDKPGKLCNKRTTGFCHLTTGTSWTGINEYGDIQVIENQHIIAPFWNNKICTISKSGLFSGLIHWGGTDFNTVSKTDSRFEQFRFQFAGTSDLGTALGVFVRLEVGTSIGNDTSQPFLTCPRTASGSPFANLATQDPRESFKDARWTYLLASSYNWKEVASNWGTNGTVPLFFFVAKGEDVWLRWVIEIYGGGGTRNINAQYSNPLIGEQGLPWLWVTDAAVY